MGRIFDERGNRMTPTYAVKKGVRYRYYISAALVQGQPEKAAKLSRVPAVPIEKVIASAVRKHLTSQDELDPNRPALLTDKDLISTYVARVEVEPDHLAIHLQLSIASEQQGGAWKEAARQGCENGNDQTRPVGRDSCNHLQTEILRVPWEKPPSKQSREVLPPVASSSRQDRRPIRAETRAKLVTAIASSRQWLDELVAGTINNVEQIADREKFSIRQINRAMTLAFLAPGLVQAAIEGRLPRGIGVARLRDLPTEWAAQYKLLGLSLPQPHF